MDLMSRASVVRNISVGASSVPRGITLVASTINILRFSTLSNFFISGSSCTPDNRKLNRKSKYLNILISKSCDGRNEDEVFQSLMHDRTCNEMPITHEVMDGLLHRYRDDYKCALGTFRWAKSRGYQALPEHYDKLVDILGKMKKMEKMRELVEEMNENGLLSLNTVAKVMRRYAGAGEWKQAVRAFDELDTFGLPKNTEAMNLLLDTLCKECKVERARDIFLELKSHITPDSRTFNIFIHGWCKINRVDEAQWTIQEMKGHGYRPCVISYSTIIRSYCLQLNFHKVFELLDEMEAQGCHPNVVTYTTVMYSLTKAGDFQGALQIPLRMQSNGCKPDTPFYNAFIYTLDQAGKVQEALNVFAHQMPKADVKPNTTTYNSIISMLCHHGEERKALEFLKDMENSSHCKPDLQSFYPLLKLFLKYQKPNSCLRELIDDMVNKYHLSFDLSTYTLLIHGLCRVDRCEWAYLIFEEMIGQELKPSFRTCYVLLDEVKRKNMYDAADKIETHMETLKNCSITRQSVRIS